MATRIEILAHEEDGRALQIQKRLGAQGKDVRVQVADVYTLECIPPESFVKSLINPVTQKVNARPETFDWALEIGYLPGVTDNIGHTATELLELAGQTDESVYSSRLYFISGDLNREKVQDLAATLANKLIQRIHIKSRAEFDADGGMDTVIPKVDLHSEGHVADNVDLDLSDEDLATLGAQGIPNQDGSRRGPLGLSLLYLKAIRDYFKKEGRAATDIEIETLAQTWSEHCKHTIFASPIDEIKDGIYRHYIKRATQDIRAKRGDDDFCVSVFSDNAGGIVFDENWLITDKVETHNSPSALDPFGGSITGIVGVNRDCIGFGQGAKPVINRYGFCFADPRSTTKYYRDKACSDALLSPEAIMNGVVAGVEAGGNCSGIPTPQGFVYFDDRYAGKPLVFVGTIGLIPREINGQPGHEKAAKPGDHIIMVGGRVGRDGIHGATFSSVALDEGSPATAVQIGDPITQKKMSDAIIKELRDQGLYNAITDNGAGGLSSSVGEMAEQSGGFVLELDQVPLKYPGMAPWEIWISESQERMTLSVPPENVEQVIAFFARRGVEATSVGTYTDSGRAVINWQGESIMDMDMDFLHDGVPETPLTTAPTTVSTTEPTLPTPKDSTEYTNELCKTLSGLNVCSREFITTQYDHEVQGGAVLKPLQGPGRVYAEASITKPLLDNPRGVVLSQGLAPRYSDIDAGAMAANALDMAVRNAVAAGCDFNHLALLDNFCWCSSDDPERLGQLKDSSEAIYNLAVHYETPFISGKDSMFNDFKGYDADGNPVKISVPPTLLISSIGVISDVAHAISLAPKAEGDLLYVLGATKNELGGSEYYAAHGEVGANVPQVDGHMNRRLYKLYSQASRKDLIASALPVGFGGLGAALAKKAIAGQTGLDVHLPETDLRPDQYLFSESAGRILVTVAPHNKAAFEKQFGKLREDYLTHLGHVAYTDKLNINNILQADLQQLDEAYKATLQEY